MKSHCCGSFGSNDKLPIETSKCVIINVTSFMKVTVSQHHVCTVTQNVGSNQKSEYKSNNKYQIFSGELMFGVAKRNSYQH